MSGVGVAIGEIPGLACLVIPELACLVADEVAPQAHRAPNVSTAITTPMYQEVTVPVCFMRV